MRYFNKNNKNKNFINNFMYLIIYSRNFYQSNCEIQLYINLFHNINIVF